VRGDWPCECGFESRAQKIDGLIVEQTQMIDCCCRIGKLVRRYAWRAFNHPFGGLHISLITLVWPQDNRMHGPAALAKRIGTAHIEEMTKTLLSIGHGYSARALGALLHENGGWRVIGTTRSTDNFEALRGSGAEPLIWPGGDIRPALDSATHLLISAGPREGGDPVLAEISNEIARAAPHLEWVGYLSTTGVYGDHDGEWVDEDTPLSLTALRGRLRQEAEAAWQAIPGLPLHIFRLAGIYGPGRGPFAKVRSGRARRIIKPGQVFSRIHVEDIAQVLAASMRAPDPGRVYNLCDDDPAPPQDVIGYAAELLGLPLPNAVTFEDAEMTDMARSFYADSKRVRNDRIKNELGVTLRYPTYREGLAAIVAAEG
jgi:nucleoside-diphosphate-sugar epimerase